MASYQKYPHWISSLLHLKSVILDHGLSFTLLQYSYFLYFDQDVLNKIRSHRHPEAQTIGKLQIPSLFTKYGVFVNIVLQNWPNFT